MTEYRLERISDLLAVPVEHRAECLRELEYALAFHEFVHGEKAASIPVTEIVWTHDGDKTVTLTVNDEMVLKLEVTAEAPTTPDTGAGGKG